MLSGKESRAEKRIRGQFQYVEVEPPFFTWDKIAKELDEQSKGGFVTKLYEHEVIPAHENWQKIASSLSEDDPDIISHLPAWLHRIHQVLPGFTASINALLGASTTVR